MPLCDSVMEAVESPDSIELAVRLNGELIKMGYGGIGFPLSLAKEFEYDALIGILKIPRNDGETARFIIQNKADYLIQLIIDKVKPKYVT